MQIIFLESFHIKLITRVRNFIIFNSVDICGDAIPWTFVDSFGDIGTVLFTIGRKSLLSRVPLSFLHHRRRRRRRRRHGDDDDDDGGKKGG